MSGVPNAPTRRDAAIHLREAVGQQEAVREVRVIEQHPHSVPEEGPVRLMGSGLRGGTSSNRTVLIRAMTASTMASMLRSGETRPRP